VGGTKEKLPLICKTRKMFEKMKVEECGALWLPGVNFETIIDKCKL